MIDEQFLQSAVRIRRTYLKLSNNMNFYQKSAADILDKLENTIKEIDEVSEKAKKEDSNSENLLKDLMGILEKIELDGKRLEELINPLNKEIENLAIEEQELYRNIKEKHYDLSEEQIVNSVKDRLEKENLS